MVRGKATKAPRVQNSAPLLGEKQKQATIESLWSGRKRNSSAEQQQVEESPSQAPLQETDSGFGSYQSPNSETSSSLGNGSDHPEQAIGSVENTTANQSDPSLNGTSDQSNVADAKMAAKTKKTVGVGRKGAKKADAPSEIARIPVVSNGENNENTPQKKRRPAELERLVGAENATIWLARLDEGGDGSWPNRLTSERLKSPAAAKAGSQQAQPGHTPTKNTRPATTAAIPITESEKKPENGMGKSDDHGEKETAKPISKDGKSDQAGVESIISLDPNTKDLFHEMVRMHGKEQAPKLLAAFLAGEGEENGGRPTRRNRGTAQDTHQAAPKGKTPVKKPARSSQSMKSNAESITEKGKSDSDTSINKQSDVPTKQKRSKPNDQSEPAVPEPISEKGKSDHTSAIPISAYPPEVVRQLVALHGKDKALTLLAEINLFGEEGEGSAVRPTRRHRHTAEALQPPPSKKPRKEPPQEAPEQPVATVDESNAAGEPNFSNQNKTLKPRRPNYKTWNAAAVRAWRLGADRGGDRPVHEYDVVWVIMKGYVPWPGMVVRNLDESEENERAGQWTHSYDTKTGPRQEFHISYFGSKRDFVWVPRSMLIFYANGESDLNGFPGRRGDDSDQEYVIGVQKSGMLSQMSHEKRKEWWERELKKWDEEIEGQLKEEERERREREEKRRAKIEALRAERETERRQRGEEATTPKKKKPAAEILQQARKQKEEEERERREREEARLALKRQKEEEKEREKQEERERRAKEKMLEKEAWEKDPRNKKTVPCVACEQIGANVVCNGPCKRKFHKECKPESTQQPETTQTDSTNTNMDSNHDHEPTESKEHAADAKKGKKGKVGANRKEPKSKSADRSEGQSEGSGSEAKEIRAGPVLEKFLCTECRENSHVCFRCKKGGDVHLCLSDCGRFYHTECMRSLPYVRYEGSYDRFNCPLHVCATCNRPASTGKSVRCTRCSVSYHREECVPATVVWRGGNSFTCASHINEELAQQDKLTKRNIDWCRLCTEGGELILCDSCPAAYHSACFGPDFKTNENESWYCPECVEGKSVMPGEIVWAKLGGYRWWPARIIPEDEIPERVMESPHGPTDVCVYFFGSKDKAWLNSMYVITYCDVQKCRQIKSGPFKESFKRALDEVAVAQEEYEKKVAERMERLAATDKFKPFKRIGRNLYTTKCPKNLDMLPQECFCKDMPDNTRCGLDCINRATHIECSPAHCDKEKCQNQQFQKKQAHNVEVFKTTDGRSFGLRIKEPIKSGDFVMEYVGEVIDMKTCQQRLRDAREQNVDDFYMLVLDQDLVIDAQHKGNVARFINHSCSPNCETQKWMVNGEQRVGIFAKVDLEPGTELTFDYQFDVLSDVLGDSGKKECRCGASNCSGYLGVKAVKTNKRTANGLPQKGGPKKKAKTSKRPHHDKHCIVCSQPKGTAQLVHCRRKDCPRSYHPQCLKYIVDLPETPGGWQGWQCLWHFCDDCGRPSTHLCATCDNSWCNEHMSAATFTVSGEKRENGKRTMGTCHECKESGKSERPQPQANTESQASESSEVPPSAPPKKKSHKKQPPKEAAPASENQSESIAHSNDQSSKGSAKQAANGIKRSAPTQNDDNSRPQKKTASNTTKKGTAGDEGEKPNAFQIMMQKAGKKK